MEFFMRIATVLVALLAGFGFIVWIMWKTLQKSDDPGGLVGKWIVTAFVFVVVIVLALKLNGGGAISAFMVPIVASLFGIILGILWAPNIGALVAKPFTGLYDGGAGELERRPLYSMAEAKRKQGKYREALLEVRKQLQEFPGDYEGMMLLANIYAVDLNDVDAAMHCIEEIVRQPNVPPKNIAFALSCCADWRLEKQQDREGAKACFERIVELLPDTEQAQGAAQRLAHLTSDEMLHDQLDRRRLRVTEHTGYAGLNQPGAVSAQAPVDDPAMIAAQLVKHLNEHPLDNEAREKLALIYADNYQRLDLAVDQIEQLINTPNQLQKNVVHWLNVEADLFIRNSADETKAKEALRRITELFPGSAAAATAEKRIAYLATEMNRNIAQKMVALGVYPQKIGLAGQVPKQP